jgi:hypothetical protein
MEIISAFLSLVSAILCLAQWLVFVPHRSKSHTRRDDPASYDPEDLRRASSPIEAYWLTLAAPEP